MAKYDVFISYSRKDMAVANRLCDALDKLGVSYWIDRNIHGSANFLSEITRYIRNCRVVVFIASPNSAQSEWTQKEILFALKHKKEIIPYRIGNFHFEDNDELDFVFTNVQWIESEAAVVSALKELGCTFGSTPAPTPAPKPVPTPKSPRNPINWRKWIKGSAIGAFAVALVALFAYALFAPDTIVEPTAAEDSVSIVNTVKTQPIQKEKQVAQTAEKTAPKQSVENSKDTEVKQSNKPKQQTTQTSSKESASPKVTTASTATTQQVHTDKPIAHKTEETAVEKSIQDSKQKIATTNSVSSATAANLYSIVVNSNVGEAEVYIDGIFKGRTDSSKNFVIINNVLEGEHTLKLLYDNRSNEQRIAVNGSSLVFMVHIATATTSAPYKVGDYYNDGTKEGVVFEVTADGKHGKIVSMTQSREGLLWSSDKAETKRRIGANSKTNGAYNMAKVKAIADWQSKYPAFKWCADLGEGWYLPSIKELERFSLDNAVHDAVNRTLTSKGGVKLFNRGDEFRWYWSSTERNEQHFGMFCAWYVGMRKGSTDGSDKSDGNYVRAVSAF